LIKHNLTRSVAFTRIAISLIEFLHKTIEENDHDTHMKERVNLALKALIKQGVLG
jgi:hypothetical protein